MRSEKDTVAPDATASAYEAANGRVLAAEARDAEPGLELRRGAVLAVEDNALLGSLLKSMLGSLGLRVAIVTTGSAALAALARDHYDVVLMDWELPEMSGPDAARAMRRAFGAARLPIVCMTGHSIGEHDAAWLAADMDGLLSKPFRLNDLRKTLARWLPGLDDGQAI